MRYYILFLGMFFATLSFSYQLSCSEEHEGDDNTPAAEAELPSTLADQYQDNDLFEKYQKKLRQMVQKCDELNMPLEKEITSRMIWETDPKGFHLLAFSTNPLPESLPEDSTDKQKSWYKALLRLRTVYSDRIYQHAEAAAAERKGCEAIRLAFKTLGINPDHAGARSVFGYSLEEGQWRTTWESRQYQKGLVDHPQFGWIKKEDVPQYEQGKRLFRGQWITKEEDDARVKTARTGWRVESEHYILDTSYSIEEGVRLVRLLENFYQAWRQLFYRFMASDRQWAQVFSGSQKIQSRRHRIVLFRDRKEYLSELGKIENNIEYSHGGYFPQMESIFIYIPGKKEDVDLETMLIHEATHQLFQECRPAGSTKQRKKNRVLPARTANFWVLEAMSTYMETFRQTQKGWFVGGTDSVRFQRAKERLEESGGYLPLEKFASLSLEAFQSYPDLPMLYTQAAGLASFFFHYDNGRYRNAFIVYLFLVYEELDTPYSLERVTGQKFEELDQQYRQFMAN